MTRVLVVDDEPQILRALRTSLSARGHEVLVAANGETALDLVASADPDLVVLDLGLPGIDGIEATRRIRSFSTVPIIVLSVREGQADKVAALDAGADDYVTKPFAMEELLARMRAVGRRAGTAEATEPVLRFGPLVVDLPKHRVTRGEEPIHLTPTEWQLLEAFVTHPGKLLTHRWLLGRVWGAGYGEESHYLRVFVAALRKKLEAEPGRPRWLLTEPGVGYRWAEPGG
ncbi:MAG TPA: response regulator transcription factor [Actinomycetota bacterium]|nr:response regulator transcription factor [Actinomycetota bacterium]